MKMVSVSNFDINNEENNMRETIITSSDFLNLSRPMSPLYRNQSVDLLSKSTD